VISIWKVRTSPPFQTTLVECTAVRHAFEPSESNRRQNPSSDESLEVITTLAPVRQGWQKIRRVAASDHADAERKCTRRRDLTAFIVELDVPHGHKCIGNSDSYLASQVIVVTSGKTECLVVC